MLLAVGTVVAVLSIPSSTGPTGNSQENQVQQKSLKAKQDIADQKEEKSSASEEGEETEEDVQSKKTEEGGSNFEQLYCNWAYTVISATKQGKVKGVFTKVTKRKGGRGFEFPNAFSSDKKRKRKK